MKGDLKEALFYEKLDGGKIRCLLCRRRCVIGASKRGFCQVRENIDGTLYSLVYGLCVAENVDPIEKKPFFHFYPGSRAFSIATVGCNFSCLHCQNYDISQAPREGRKIFGKDLPPKTIVELAKLYKCKSISYTYTEPTIYFEYALDTAKIAKENGIMNNFVTNGYISKEALLEISEFLDAANIDLKAFSEKFYRDICGGIELKEVLSSIETYKSLGIWVEITTLVIPGLNDSEDELKKIALYIKSLGEETPWHVSAFYPTYKMLDRKRTPKETLDMAREIGLSVGLRYVYEGNVPGALGENTYCYKCGKLLIERFGFSIMKNEIKGGRCPDCGAKIDGLGMDHKKEGDI